MADNTLSGDNTDNNVETITGSFSYSSAPSVGVSSNYVLFRTGRLIHLQYGGVSPRTATSAVVAQSNVFIPADMRPAIQRNFVFSGRSAGTWQGLICGVQTSGAIVVIRLATAGAFSGSDTTYEISPTNFSWYV